MKDFDSKISLPSRFYQYLEKIKESHKLIIKSKDGYHCDSCNSDFKICKQNKQYGETYAKCPVCKKNLVVKSNRKKYYTQDDSFCIIEKFKDYLIFRLFAVETEYDAPNNYHSKYCEYGRQIYSYESGPLFLVEEVYNDNITATISGKWINYRYIYGSNWKANGSYFHHLGNVSMLYPYNLKKVLKGTKWEYSQIWDFAKHIDYFNISAFLQHKSLEMLIKSKLYNLAYSIINEFDDYLIKLDYKFLHNNLIFVRKNKMDLEEYQLFEKTKIKNIKLIRKYAPDYDNFIQIFFDLKIDLARADNQIKNLEGHIQEYIDYLEICKMLQYDMKDKKILYPEKDIVEEHNRVNSLYEAYKDEVYNNAIKKRAQELKDTIYQSDKFVIFPVKNQSQLINESKQQNNCVKTYVERIARGECDIYFMRLVNSKEKSLVTVEVRNNRVVQQRIKNNEDTTNEQKQFLKNWEEKFLKSRLNKGVA